MSSRFRIYSDILQLRSRAYLTLKHANGGLRYAAGMFAAVTLFAGLGLLVGLPALLQRPLIVERIDQVNAWIDQFDQEVVPEINQSLDAISQENLSAALGELITESGAVSTEALTDAINQAGLSVEELGNALTAEAAELSAEARAQLETQLDALEQEAMDRGLVETEQLEQLLDQSALTADQAAALLRQAAEAGVLIGEMAESAAVQDAPQIQALLAQVASAQETLQSFLTRLALAPEQLAALTIPLGLTPQQLDTLRANIDAAPDQANTLLDDLRANVERFQPPLGTRLSRFLHMVGQWLATPLDILARWAFFGFLLLIVAKTLGGTGTLRQHLTGLLLVGAPLFLLFFNFVPNVTPALPLSFNLAFDLFGRVLTILAVIWAGLILLKSMSVTHEFSMWRSLGSIALTWALIYVIFPLISAFAFGYLLRG
jgi:hypothetical protein